MHRSRRFCSPSLRLSVVAGIVVTLLSVGVAGTAGAASSPDGFKASFSGALKGKAKGGTTDAACSFSPRPLTNQDLTLPDALQAVIGVVTTHWDDFTVKGKTASLSLEVGSPLSGNPGQTEYEVPWETGAPRGTADIVVTTDAGEFVPTTASKPLVTTTDSKAHIDTILRSGKKKLHVKATIDCRAAQAANPAGEANPDDPTSVGP